MDYQKIYRVIDANLNRCREGLRVVEEITRLVIENSALAQKFKSMRHNLTQVSTNLASPSQILTARQSKNDIGRKGWHKDEKERGNYLSLIHANMSRAQEAARVLEEFTKILNEEEVSLRFKELRFSLYDLEQEVCQTVVEWEALSHP